MPATRILGSLKVEVAKIIEKGVSLGIINSNKEEVQATKDNTETEQHGGVKVSNMIPWNLEVELARTLETGVALGFNFHGKENEILEVILSKEQQDEERGIGVEAEGASGGLISLWNNELFSVKACVSNKRCIILQREILELKKLVVFCNVYAVTVESERRQLWEYLLEASSIISYAVVHRRWLDSKKNDSITSKDIEKKLEDVDRKAGRVGWSEDMCQLRTNLLDELWKNLRKEELIWKQKSRVNWLKEGDKNTKFYHSMANGRRRINFIGDFVIEGHRVTDPLLVKNGVCNFFKSHF
ncbi:hypothetical protein Dsin_022747 [Dipteronia sinensis]|uniref:Uncharacterized protein n=1 Tax=Dipteronia sinensis TaxID=43782 RepID=A0AAE0E1F6_9ROSI|nr:hypothetical protein Dsin_022747 [Dipteronia sinensis]